MSANTQLIITDAGNPDLYVELPEPVAAGVKGPDFMRRLSRTLFLFKVAMSRGVVERRLHALGQDGDAWQAVVDPKDTVALADGTQVRPNPGEALFAVCLPVPLGPTNAEAAAGAIGTIIGLFNPIARLGWSLLTGSGAGAAPSGSDAPWIRVSVAASDNFTTWRLLRMEHESADG
jgi:hypothetical protein